MPECLEDLLMMRPPTADRPLLGVMILVVEDSRFACDALRLICQRSGARIRRAESLASATRHLRAYRPRIAIVDLGLPDGSGLSLISQLAGGDPRIDGIIATSGDDSQADGAMAAGADAFMPKPLASVSAFQSAVLRLLPTDIRPSRVSPPPIDCVEPDPIALKDDLSLAAELLSGDPDGNTIDYVASFLKSLARSSGDDAIAGFGREIDALRHGIGGSAKARQIAARIRDQVGSLATV